MPTTITELVFQNAGVATLEGGYTTVGQAFQPGALMPGQTLLAQLGGVSVPVQVDVRTTHPDGSVKMAALTLARPTLEPWQEVTAELVAGGTAPAATPVSLPGVLAGHNATLTLAIEDGRPPLSIDIDAAVSQAVAQGTASFWQKGPLATQARVEIPVADSSMRVVLDVTAYKDGEIRFTVGLNNDRAMEATGGRLSYVATVTLDGETLFNQGISQGQYQRVSLDFASSEKHGVQGLGAPHEGWLNVKHDIDYLVSTNAVFPYSTEFTAEPATLRAYYDQVANNPLWGEVLWNHNVTKYMGTAGGRPDVGYTTAPNANWLLSQDAAAASYALGQAKVAGYVPWNFYDMAHGEVLNTDNYPRLWTDVRGGTGTPGDSNSGGLTQQIPTDTGWAADRAHQPDLSFVPYLLTGERWIYDNLMSQASHSIMNTGPTLRGGETGAVLADAQLRGAAWSMRQIDHAAWAAVDGSAEQDYFTEKVEDNWNWLLSKVPEWTETWGELAGFIPTTGDRAQLWQMNLVGSVAALSAARGSEEAREALDFIGNFLLGMATSASEGLNPHNAALISIPHSVNGTPIDSWAELADALRAEGRYVESFAGTTNEYQKIVVSSLAMLYQVTGDQRYRDAAESFLALQPPGTSYWAYAHQPQFGLTIAEWHEAYRGDARYPDGAFEPLTILRGSGPDEIRLSISQDYFNGSAQYRVLVDGNDLTGALTASGLKSRADADTLIIRGDFGSTVTVRVQMLNDFWGGSTDKDRNLYVNALSYNGENLPTHAYLANNTAKDFVLTAGAAPVEVPPPAEEPPPPPVEEPPPAEEPPPPPVEEPPPAEEPPPPSVEEPPPAADLPARVSFGTDRASAEAGMFIAAEGVTATYSGAETTIRNGAASVIYGPNSVEVEVTSAWNTIRAIAVTDSDGGAISVANAVEVAISATGPGDAAITVHDVKRGTITTGAGDDSIVVNAFSNAPGLLNNDNTFLISTGAGDDTIDVSGWKTWTAARIDAGAGSDTITATAGADRITGGAGDDVMAGGAGRDWFIFRRGDGHDTITDFNPDRLTGDIIEFVGLTKTEITCAVSAEGTLLSYGEADSIWLPGVQASLDWPVVRIIEGDQIA